jgi:hypothetical protein
MKAFLAVIFFACLLASHPAAGQDSDVLDIRFIKAKFTDPKTRRDVIVAILVMAKDTSDFPPQVNIPPKCTAYESGFEKVVLLNPHNLSGGIIISLAGNYFKSYNLIMIA